MRRLLSLLILVAVLGCGLHLGETVVPHAEAAPHHLALDEHSDAGKGDTSPDKPAKLADTGHHHCPIATDSRHAAIACAPASAMILAARRAATLDSLPLAPLDEPPAA